jgi:hypothetical protein
VHIGLLSGSAQIKGLVVGNPDGCKTPNAISVGLAEVGVDPISILSDKIVVRSVHVESPEITFEGGLGGNNLSKILDNVNEYAKTGGPVATNAAASTASPTSRPGKKIEVDDFLITGAKVHASLTGIGGGIGGKEMTLPLPDIHLTDLGKGGDGLTSADLTHAVLSAITTATVKAVASSATAAGKTAIEGVNKIKQGIGGLWGK